MSSNLKRRIKALEMSRGADDAEHARRWLDWQWGSQRGPEPRGREAANRLLLRALMELARD